MDNQYDSPQWEQQLGNLPVGEVLRRTRLYYGLSLADVELALRIRSCLLSAIEDGRHDLLPGRVYAIGFVRAYSEYLGLDGSKMVYLFKSQAGGGRNKPELSMPVPASESKLPGFWILGGSGTALVLIIMILFLTGSPDKPRVIPDVPRDMVYRQVNLLPESPVETVMANLEANSGATMTKAVLDTPPISRITLNVDENVWVEIRDADGEILLSRILEPGSRYEVPNEPGLVMDVGNAGALSLLVDGRQGPSLGETGDVLRRIPLDPDMFLKEMKDVDVSQSLAQTSPAAGE